jgi:thiamine-monophosphate kinase
MKTSEDRLIRQIARLGKSQRQLGLPLGIGDDAALLEPKPGYQIILTCDWFLEGTHFLRRKHPPDSVGWKCLARALSDIAAMGGRPRCFLLSLAIPDALTGRWLAEFLKGLRRAAREFRCALAGGDTTRKAEVGISITVVGEIRGRQALHRAGARPGDLIFVSGVLGMAELGLKRLRRGGMPSGKPNPLVTKHLYPEPRLALGQWLAQSKATTALMDLSDGLSTDLARLCAASCVGAHVDLAQLPCWAPPKRKQERAKPNNSNSEALQAALNGGDDYELLFTVAPKSVKRIPETYSGLRLTCIGQVTRSRHLVLSTPTGRRVLSPRGWDPFRRKSQG